MIAVLFEVTLRDQALYLDWAEQLKIQLMQQDGFISVERFASLTTPSKMLSLSFWQDEAAVARWRRHTQHEQAQAAGRQSAFAHYRICVAQVLRDYSMTDRQEAPDVSTSGML